MRRLIVVSVVSRITVHVSAQAPARQSGGDHRRGQASGSRDGVTQSAAAVAASSVVSRPQQSARLPTGPNAVRAQNSNGSSSRGGRGGGNAGSAPAPLSSTKVETSQKSTAPPVATTLSSKPVPQVVASAQHVAQAAAAPVAAKPLPHPATAAASSLSMPQPAPGKPVPMVATPSSTMRASPERLPVCVVVGW
jgi:hypothetical protein